MRHTIRPLILAALLLTTSLASGSAATESVFPPRVTDANTEFSLHGEALLRYKVVFKVYNIGLYLGDGVSASSVFEDVPKRLEVRYLLGLSRDNIVEAGSVALEASVDRETLSTLQERIDRINSWYQDVGKGDTYTMTYVPGRGTELSLNGSSKGIIEGADFAAAYFKIWLGDNAPRPDVRDKLLRR